MSSLSVKSQAATPTSVPASSTPVSAPAGALVVVTADNYRYLQQEIYRESGIVIDQDKHYLLESRLMPVARQAQLTSLDQLCAKLRAKTSPELARQVIQAMTTNETLFFRDIAPFDAMRQRLIPELIEKGASKISIWSAAASSGQQAYSIAMLLKEMKVGEIKPGEARAKPAVDILGTDLSEQILDRAREAKYVQFEVNRGLPAAYLVKYFKREGLDWQLKDEIRAMVRFRRFDLRQTMAVLGKFDIVFCRNVLIYFDVETKVSILTQILNVLNPGGYLLLGGAETTLNLHDKFERIAIGTTAVYRKR